MANLMSLGILCQSTGELGSEKITGGPEQYKIKTDWLKITDNPFVVDLVWFTTNLAYTKFRLQLFQQRIEPETYCLVLNPWAVAVS